MDVDRLMELVTEYGESCYSTGDGCLEDCNDAHLPGIRAAAQALAVPEGWKLVPVEPTPEMLDEVFDRDSVEAIPCTRLGLANSYRAMLAAAPQSMPGEATERDAARYRWLRDADQSDPTLPYSELLCFAGESLDAAIDAAMQASTPAQGDAEGVKGLGDAS